ncbi:hypothetical protein [Granulicella tundricola]|uniref:Uncharacterized protein n=1 Tax=Granulicella tundricola (strain ATCC BAA-1859 / DSM 23138 / MP5ACTX9) TaxID=1198114 RepID=E8WW88_GRATM|nr:hypothetical protein [Granulicella tundricola]ADW68471.1 hypothetical protein AciX9_1413 [Granulicella tundricola MP5ACTX9]
MTMNSSTSRPTTDHNQIRLWASSQNAMPAELLPGHVDSVPTQLHFFIPGNQSHEPRLRIIGWEDFFAAFEAHGLAFVYEILPGGKPGRRFELLQIEDKSPAAQQADALPHDSDTAQQSAE